ncbi:unnamed protein product [Clavelina lepadiformis]|uniref:Senescence-associated protein n=1 Tax=Clavelina lepadiformis TaxID=159417 RepID=A0ABP0FCI6_CLALP
MIGRADIEGSKSNVAMNAWLPQASYPCGNFSDTSCLKLPSSKGSIGHAFAVCIHTENQNQMYRPSPNSPPDTVFRANRAPPEGDALKARNVTRSCSTPAESEPEPALAAVFHEKRPTQVQAHARRRMEAGVRPVRYGSSLPTSLTYIVLSARGCSPWRPAADMGTISHENYTFSLGFSRADASSPDTTRDVVLYGAHVPISGRTDSRVAAPYQEKRTLPGTHASVSEFVCVAALGAEAPISVSRFGNINPIPFRTTGATRASPRFRTAFAYPLGSTDPCSTAVHMEPFSTSAFKVLI